MLRLAIKSRSFVIKKILSLRIGREENDDDECYLCFIIEERVRVQIQISNSMDFDILSFYSLRYLVVAFPLKLKNYNLSATGCFQR